MMGEGERLREEALAKQNAKTPMTDELKKKIILDIHAEVQSLAEELELVLDRYVEKDQKLKDHKLNKSSRNLIAARALNFVHLRHNIWLNRAVSNNITDTEEKMEKENGQGKI